MDLRFDLPNINDVKPHWNGEEFFIGDTKTNVLQYSSNSSGWDDELTFFHEESAGHQHPIDVVSRTLAINALKKNLKNHKSSTILEIGCSSGYLLKELKEKFPNAQIMGADVVSEPLVNLSEKLKNTPLFQFDLTKCPLPDACIDAIVMLNVLEHIENDLEALKQAYRILKPGGILVIEVPAGPHLYDIYDKQLRHFRRYSSQELESKVKTLNFEILKSSHLGFFLYPLFAYVKNKNKQLQISDLESKKMVEKNIKSTQSNFIFKTLMFFELSIYDWIKFPTGIRCTMSCLKK
jgi:ubiquinone/menaquinone biosynthesis C-methylase UbiE